MQRQEFIKKSLLFTGMAAFSPTAFAQAGESELFTAEEIREFVVAAHRSFEETKRIVTAKPLIINCTNQGRRGDFETAIGGASHVGQKDIADLLVEHGARLDIFNLTFLGHTDLVKKLVEVAPHYLNAPGPHGFTLLHHAKVGEHTDFADWLQGQGLTETKFDTF